MWATTKFMHFIEYIRIGLVKKIPNFPSFSLLKPGKILLLSLCLGWNLGMNYPGHSTAKLVSEWLSFTNKQFWNWDTCTCNILIMSSLLSSITEATAQDVSRESGSRYISPRETRDVSTLRKSTLKQSKMTGNVSVCCYEWLKIRWKSEEFRTHFLFNLHIC